MSFHVHPAPRIKKTIPTREVTIYIREDGNGKLYLAPRTATLLGGSGIP
jgi:hypothetical protein